ncbi:MAG: ATP-dependent Clp protease adaptor ClpS [Planctomycetes bacterium]|nr:ATP-dependent Clp protease adaptor ClpS [Planctomycetota bacterium]MCW8136636.1 ATP-dependent Clp protease adaptor ClpS [Planctomycetota bacterium]
MDSDLYVYVAAPDDPRWSQVAGMTRALEGELVAGHVPPPELDMLASGALSPKCQVFLASKGDQAVGMLAAVALGDREAELMGLYVKPELRGRYIGQQLVAVGESFLFHSRLFVITADERNNVSGTAGVLDRHEFKSLGNGRWRRDELAKIGKFLAEYHERCLSFGGGNWAVMVYNDDVTTTDAVIAALKAVFDLGEQAAHEVMYVTHYGGSAPAWRYSTEKEAQQMAARLRLEFRNAGYGTQVAVSPVAALDSPVLLPASWPTDSPPD